MFHVEQSDAYLVENEWIRVVFRKMFPDCGRGCGRSCEINPDGVVVKIPTNSKG